MFKSKKSAPVVAFILTLILLTAVTATALTLLGSASEAPSADAGADGAVNPNVIFFASEPTDEQITDMLAGNIPDADSLIDENDLPEHTALSEQAKAVAASVKYTADASVTCPYDFDGLLKFSDEMSDKLSALSAKFFSADTLAGLGDQSTVFTADYGKSSCYAKTEFANGGVTEYYETPERRFSVGANASQSIGDELKSAVCGIAGYYTVRLPGSTSLYPRTSGDGIYKTSGKAVIADCGYLDGRQTVRVTGAITDLKYLAPKTGVYTYEAFYDLETGCRVAFLGYGADGALSKVDYFSGLVFADTLDVPSYSD